MTLRCLIFICLLFPSSTFAQVWPKIYGGNTANWCQGLLETYDKGYLIAVQVDPGSSVPQMYAWLIKADINGNQLWSKTISSNAYAVSFNGLDNTSDGGFIVTGVTSKLDPANYDIIFMKFNSCGEKEWCNILSTPGNDDYGIKIKQVSGGYIALCDYYKNQATQPIWLIKLGLSGDIIWQQSYLDSNTYGLNEFAYDFQVCSDSSFIISGDGYFLPKEKKTWFLMPLFIKASSDGMQQWVLPYGQNNGFRGDIPQCPSENQAGFFYSTGRHFRQTAPYGDSPCFLKVSPTGQGVYYKDLITNSISGGSTTLNLHNDDSLFISAAWQDVNNTENIGIFKLDTVGNITITKLLLQNKMYNIRSATFVYNDKYLASGNFNTDSSSTKIYLYKFNLNLDYAPLDTQPQLYDSLCPHQIISDTTNLDDCAIITNVDDPFRNPEKFNLAVYPNPARDKLTIEIPGKLARKTGSGAMQITTIYHQWDKASLEIYDLSGKLVFSKEINKQTERVDLNVGTWQTGMYAARLVFMNSIVAEAKFVVER